MPGTLSYEPDHADPHEHMCRYAVTNNHQAHIPVLASQLVGLTKPAPGMIGVDCTLGAGGHARAIMQATCGQAKLIGVDADPHAIDHARDNLAEFTQNVTLIRHNFAQITEILADLDIRHVNFIYADLGISSLQLACPDRGFSFSADGPLDMRFDPDADKRAADLVNGLREGELADLIFQYGQEPRSRKIAHLICQARRTRRIDSTGQLAQIVCHALGIDPNRLRAGRKHPATKTFQALRIAVNDELGQLQRLLKQAPDLLAPAGTLAIISFHSLEDALVKHDFRSNTKKGVYKLVTRKPIAPEPSEILKNPRARSAKLRAAEKIAHSADHRTI